MWFTKISIKNPVLATMMMLAFVVLGLFSYQKLKVDQFPDINFPVVVIITEYPGASPESVEADVSKKIEEVVNTISNISKLSSRSYEGQSVVIVEFDLSVDPAKAAQDVREKVAIVKPILRKEVKDSRVLRFDPSDRPVISLSLTSPQRSTRELTTLADQLVKLHGGTARVESEVGRGSAFIVSIPFGKAHLPAENVKTNDGEERARAATAPSARAFVEEALRWTPIETKSHTDGETQNVEAMGAALPSFPSTLPSASSPCLPDKLGRNQSGRSDLRF